MTEKKSDAKVIDPNLPFIFIPSRHSKTKKHDQVLAILAFILYKCGFEVNYDHIKLTIPKNKDIPLIDPKHDKSKKYDLAFIFDKETIVLLEIKTINIRNYNTNKHGEGKIP